jgi:hypothetical protein
MHYTVVTVDAAVNASLGSEYEEARSDGCFSSGDPTVRVKCETPSR